MKIFFSLIICFYSLFANAEDKDTQYFISQSYKATFQLSISIIREITSAKDTYDFRNLNREISMPLSESLVGLIGICENLKTAMTTTTELLDKPIKIEDETLQLIHTFFGTMEDLCDNDVAIYSELFFLHQDSMLVRRKIRAIKP